MVLHLLGLICLLVCSVLGSSERTRLKCIAFDHADGCSVPLRDIFFPYAAVFEKACDLHDVCYDCVSIFLVSLRIGNKPLKS